MSTLSSNKPQIYEQINGYFSEQDKQKRAIQEAREILGDSSESLNDKEISELVTEMQFLVENWLEDYEKSVFDGKTLKELIKLE